MLVAVRTRHAVGYSEMIHKIRPILATAAACLLGASSALAFEVTIDAPDAVASGLRTGSLTAALLNREDGQEAAQSIDILSAAQADYRRLIGVLYEQGYFAPQISILIDGREAKSISPVGAPSAVANVVIKVDPGAVFTFGAVSITPVAPNTAPSDRLTTGEVASISALRAGTAEQIEGWRQAGHAKAAIASQEIIARHPDKTMNATITLDPGPRLRFGKVSIEGESAVREKRIRQIMGWSEGEVFDPDELEDVETRLRRTGTFAAANLTEAEVANPDGTLDITATISDQLPRRYSFGAEYGTDDGLSLSALWMHRNIFGGAERLVIGGEISGAGSPAGGIDYRLGALLNRPATFYSDLDAYLLAEIEQIDDPNLLSRKIRLEAGGTYYASDDLELSLGAGFQRAQTRDGLGERDYTIFTIPMTATYDRRDDPVDATSGYYIKGGLQPFLSLNGTENGVVTTLDMRTYRQVGQRVTLALRGVVGSVAGPDITLAPADFLFFSGGSDTVRGQEYKSLGVELSPGVTVGGRSYLGIAGEVRVKTTNSLSIVGFYDAGYIGAESFYDGSGEWHTGYGAGVRYDTPIGPIRFDIAVPGSGPGKQSGVEIYIGIGQAF